MTIETSFATAFRTSKPGLLAASIICMGCLCLAGPSQEAQNDFSGTWIQNNDRCVPQPRNKSYVYKMKVEAIGAALGILVSSGNGRAERTLTLNYEIGGKELVYTGIDGDEFHAKVRRDGGSLVFTAVEHERGRLIPFQETWTLIDSGKALQRIKVSGGTDKESKRVYVLECAP